MCYRNNSYPKTKTKKTKQKKQTNNFPPLIFLRRICFEKYTILREHPIFPSRSHLLQFEEATNWFCRIETRCIYVQSPMLALQSHDESQKAVRRRDMDCPQKKSQPCIFKGELLKIQRDSVQSVLEMLETGLLVLRDSLNQTSNCASSTNHKSDQSDSFSQLRFNDDSKVTHSTPKCSKFYHRCWTPPCPMKNSSHAPPIPHCPSFLCKFSALWLYAHGVELAVGILEREKQYTRAIECLLLLLQSHACPERRGKWYLRLSIDWEHIG